MSMQDVLFTVSSLSFMACGFLLALAAHTYTRENMREVFDDLSGKRRQRDIEQALLAVYGGETSVPTQERMQVASRRRRKRQAQKETSVARRTGAHAHSSADSNDTTLVALDQPVQDADKTLMANASKFSLVSKTVLCGTADVVEGRDE